MDTTTLTHRLQKLEASLRRTRLMLAAAGLAAAALVACGAITAAPPAAPAQQPPTAPPPLTVPDVVMARAFAVADEKGNVKGMFTYDTGTTMLTMFDNNNKPRVQLQVMDGIPAIAVLDETAQRRVVLGMSPKGEAFTHIMDAAGNVRAAVQSPREGKSALVIFDPNGKSRTITVE